MDEIFMHGSRPNEHYRAVPLLAGRGIPSERILQSKRDSSPCKCARESEDVQVGNKNDNNERRGRETTIAQRTLPITRASEDAARLRRRINRGRSRRAKENDPREGRSGRLFHGLTILRICANECFFPYFTVRISQSNAK